MSKLLGMDGHPVERSEKVNINILDQPNVRCPTCGDALFENVVAIKRISGLLVGTPGDQLVPIPLYRCVSCGSIPTDTLPEPGALSKLLGEED